MSNGAWLQEMYAERDQLRAELDRAKAAEKLRAPVIAQLMMDRDRIQSRLDEAVRSLREYDTHPFGVVGWSRWNTERVAFLAALPASGAEKREPSVPVLCVDCGQEDAENGQHDWHHPFNDPRQPPVPAPQGDGAKATLEERVSALEADGVRDRYTQQRVCEALEDGQDDHEARLKALESATRLRWGDYGDFLKAAQRAPAVPGHAFVAGGLFPDMCGVRNGLLESCARKPDDPIHATPKGTR